MTKSYTKFCARILLLMAVMCINFAVADASKYQKADSAYLRISRLNKKEKNFLKNGYHANLPAVKTYNVPVSKPATSTADDKILSNVQIFPNPVSDQINVKYSISRTANVKIKIMDLLGNEVLTLCSQIMEPGLDIKCTRSLSPKLNSGFYFIRIVAGTETINRRISIM